MCAGLVIISAPENQMAEARYQCCWGTNSLYNDRPIAVWPGAALQRAVALLLLTRRLDLEYRLRAFQTVLAPSILS